MIINFWRILKEIYEKYKQLFTLKQYLYAVCELYSEAISHQARAIFCIIPPQSITFAQNTRDATLVGTENFSILRVIN